MMKTTKRRSGALTGLLAAVATTLSLTLLPAPVALAASRDCDKACLEGIAKLYREAYVAHDPKRLPLARDVKFSENGVMMKFPDASWDTVTKEYGPAITLSDPKTGNVGIYTAILQTDVPGFLGVRLKVRRGEITEIEHILSTKRNLSSPPTPIGDAEKYQPQPEFFATVPVEKRISRERLIAHANGYFDTLQNNTGEIRGTRFTPDASRLENGLRFDEIEARFRQGYYRFNERVRDRDFFLVDEERQIVMSRGFIDHKGTLLDYTLTDGTTKIKAIFREPQTWAFLESFKVENDHITAVHATFIQAPYYMPPPWKKK
jgi:hypothetical protein